MEEFFTLVTNFGFPIVVAGYLLFRFEHILSNLVTVNTELNNKIAALKEEVIELKSELKNLIRKRK